MKNLTVKNIANAVGGQCFGCDAIMNQEITGVEIDSRKIQEGFLFVPIRGERVDGHSFIGQVMEKGALLTFSDHKLDLDVPYILVANTETAMQALAAFYRNQLNIKVVGITGSVGKTSTKEMIASVLSQRYSVLKTEGNYNNEIGLPLTIFRITEEHQVAVLEMGIDHFGEMHRLAAMSQPDICVITNIGYAHIENLGSRDGILKAKTEVFDHLRDRATVILNGDDDKLSTIKKVQGRSPMFFSLDNKDCFYADEFQNLGLKGTRCKLHLPYGMIRVHIPVPGKHMVYNALAGALVGLKLGLTLTEVSDGIAAMKTIAGRTNQIETDSMLVIDDCYNANPASMMASLEVLTYGLGRTVAIMGDMFELGPNECALHAECGSFAAKKGIDLIICIGALSANTAAAARADSTKSEVLHFETRDAFLEAAPSIMKKGDTVLVKASHGMEFGKIVEVLTDMKL